MTKENNMPKKSAIDSPTPAKHNKEPRVSRRPKVTKKAKLISLLSKGSGVDVDNLSRKLGWQTHSTRAALSGLRKSGYEIERIKPCGGKPSRYHISGVPAEQDA
jgi:hypothetical protein